MEEGFSCLIFKTPASCRDCKLSGCDLSGALMCIDNNNYIQKYYFNRTKPVWCPLQPVYAENDSEKEESMSDQIFSPCMICKMRFGHDYSSQRCDDSCEFAKVCLENKELRKLLNMNREEKESKEV